MPHLQEDPTQAARIAAIHAEVVRSLGTVTQFAQAFGIGSFKDAARSRADIAQKATAVFADMQTPQGKPYDGAAVRELFRRAKRADGVKRGARGAISSVLSTMVFSVCVGIGGIVGGVIGACLGPGGAVLGAAFGVMAASVIAAYPCSALGTAIYHLDHQHQGSGREFTCRVPITARRQRAINAGAYALGNAVANAPMAGLQLALNVLVGGVAVSSAISGVGLALAPVVSGVGAALRVAVQEARGERVAGGLFGLQKVEGAPPASGEEQEKRMRAAIDRLSGTSTARLVLDDAREFFGGVVAGLPHALRYAVCGKGSKATLQGALALGTGGLIGGLAGLAAATALTPAAQGFAVTAVRSTAGGGLWGAARKVHNPTSMAAGM